MRPASRQDVHKRHVFCASLPTSLPVIPLQLACQLSPSQRNDSSAGHGQGSPSGGPGQITVSTTSRWSGRPASAWGTCAMGTTCNIRQVSWCSGARAASSWLAASRTSASRSAPPPSSPPPPSASSWPCSDSCCSCVRAESRPTSSVWCTSSCKQRRLGSAAMAASAASLLRPQRAVSSACKAGSPGSCSTGPDRSCVMRWRVCYQ